MNTFQRMKKHKLALFLTLALVVIVLPAGIWFLYDLQRQGRIDLNSSITEGEFYLIYGATLVFLSTILLSYLTFSQNQFANEINTRQQVLETYRLKLETQPTVLVCYWNILLGAEITSLKINYIKGVLKNHLMLNYYNASLANSDVALEIRLINTSNSFLMINYKSAALISGDTETELLEQPVNRKICLNYSQEGTLVLCFNEDELLSFDGKKLKLNLILENRFGEKYFESIELLLRELSKKSENAWSFDISSPEYSLKKFIDSATLSNELINPFAEK